MTRHSLTKVRFYENITFFFFLKKKLQTSISYEHPQAYKMHAGPSGRSPAEIVGSNPAGGMDVCLLWVLCVVR